MSDLKIIDSIQNELIRLQCDAGTDSDSGLIAVATQLGTPDEPIVKLSDDCNDCYYFANSLLIELKALETASLECDPDTNIWSLIHESEQ